MICVNTQAELLKIPNLVTFRFLRFVLCFFLCCTCAFAGQYEDKPELPAKRLYQLLDDAFTQKITDFERQLEIVAQIDELLIQQPDEETSIKTRFVEALANMRVNRISLSFTQIESLQINVSKQRYPELWFRSRSLKAALLLVSGKRSQSVQAFENLLANDLSSVEDHLVNRARVNYAAALAQNGDLGEAADLYDSIMMAALENQAHRTALHCGNNLTSILFDQGDFKSVNRILGKLQPVMEKSPDAFATLSLRLRELSLLSVEGPSDEVIDRLRDYIRQNNLPPLLIGSAHRQLAEVLLNNNKPSEALIHAKMSMPVLENRANEHADARITLARVLMKLEDYDGVIEELNIVDWASEKSPSRLTVVEALKLEANLRHAGLTEEVTMLNAMIDAASEHDRQISEQSFDYYEARIQAAEKTIALNEAQAHAHSLKLQRLAERRFRDLVMLLLAACGATFCLVVYLNFRKRAESMRLAEQASLNEKLESLVEARTRELTDSLSAKAEMAMALERKRRVEAIGQMAGNVAHDINNLLQVISTTNDAIAHPNCTPDVRNELLDVSNESLRHSAGVIKQLLSHSRRRKVSSSFVPVKDYLSSTTTLFKAAIGERVDLLINDNSRDAIVEMDESQLTTVILNLLRNAVDAMPHGGAITLSAKQIPIGTGTEVEGLDFGERELVTHQWRGMVAGDYLKIQIVDIGIGMTDGELRRAFEPFHTTKKSEAGMGLGLSSAYGYVRKCGGDIRISSEVNKGTCVELLLPLTALSHLGSSVTSSLPVQLTRQRMLLVEDHEQVAMALAALLEQLDLVVHRVPTADDAQALLMDDNDFDFILSDVHTPGNLNGIALAQWVNSEYPQLPTFIMSGKDQHSPKTHNMPMLPKPFNLEQLNSFLAKNLADA